MMIRFLIYFVLLTSSIVSSVGQEDEEVKCSRTNGSCPKGCWHRSGLVYADGSRKCVPVGFGYYSPNDDNLRHSCLAGTYSNTTNAETCTQCSPGTYSKSHGSKICLTCPRGRYSNKSGATGCRLCDPSGYYGDGANNVQVIDNKPYCSLLDSMGNELAGPNNEQDNGNNSNSTQEPTQMFSDVDMSNETFSLLDTGTSTTTTFQCVPGTYFFHGTCSKCPTRLEKIIMPVGFTIFFVVLAIFFSGIVVSSCTATVLVGIEYLQLIYLLGIIHVPWTETLDQIYKVLSIFSMDIDASVPLQCYVEIQPQANHVVVLMIPAFFFLVPFLFLQLYKATGKITEGYIKIKLQRVKNWLAIAVFFGCGKLLLTSFEAIGCSSLQDKELYNDNPIDWFCISSNNVKGSIASLIGVVGFLAYGVAFPWWFINSLSATHQANKSDESQANHDFEMPIRDVKHWTKLFLRPFQPKSWWWSGFMLGRKCVLVVVIFFLQDEPFLTLTFVMVLLMISEVIQQRRRPLWHDHDDEDAAHKQDGKVSPTRRKIWKLSTVDLVLHCCLIFAITLGLIFLAIPIESALVRFVMTVVFLLVMTPSVVYMTLAVCCCLCLDYQRGSRSLLEPDDVESNIGPECHPETCPPYNSSKVSGQADSDSSMVPDRPRDSNDQTQKVSIQPRNGSAEERSREGEVSTVEGDMAVRSQLFDEILESWKPRTMTFDDSIPTDDSSLELPTKHQKQRNHQHPELDDDPATAKPTNKRFSIIESIGNSEEEDDTGKSSHYIFADDDDDSNPSATTGTSPGFQKNGTSRTWGASSVKDDFSSSNASSSLDLFDDNTGFPITESSFGNSRRNRYIDAYEEAASTNTTNSTTSSQWMNSSTSSGTNTSSFGVSTKRHHHHRTRSSSSSTNQASKATMVLQPVHRVEPAVWGKRQANVYQPQIVVNGKVVGK